MNLNGTSEQAVGVIGSGSFGTVIANLLAENQRVYLHTRREDVYNAILKDRKHLGQEMHPQVIPVMEMEEVAAHCHLIFPIVPSKHFRTMVSDLSQFLTPGHVMVHGTKGLDVVLTEDEIKNPGHLKLRVDRVKTMSQVITDESVVLRVGCISGPNLSKEMARSLPAGTVIASHFREVIDTGQRALRSDRFLVFENYDLVGVELSGVLKNILALGSGMISGLEMGENARALMITRGWREMMRIGELFGSNKNAFMGLAGIGDMVATCTSPLSRNYTVGYRMAKGETLEEVIESMNEVAEGVNTVQVAMGLIRNYNLHSPLIKAFYAVLFEGLSINDAIRMLVAHRHGPDVDFL